MFELEEVTPKQQEKRDGKQTDAREDADRTLVADGPCAPEAGNCGPTATCGPSQP